MSLVLRSTSRTTFRDSLSRLGWPSWLAREKTVQPDGSVVEHENRALFAITTLLDEASERLRLGIEARFPGLGPPDARAQQGKDRNVLRGPSESDASYDARLIRAPDDQRQKGSPAALLNQVAGYFNPFSSAMRFRTVDNSGNWTTLDSNGITYNYFQTNWNWDGVPSSTAFGRFWLIIYPLSSGAFAQSPNLGSGYKLGDGRTLGSTLTGDQVTALKQLVVDWKPDGVMPQWIVLAFDPASFNPTAPSPGPDGHWGPWGQPASGSIVLSHRLSTARYIAVDPNIMMHD